MAWIRSVVISKRIVAHNVYVAMSSKFKGIILENFLTQGIMQLLI